VKAGAEAPSAADVVARLEEAAFADMLAKGRYDLLDAVKANGYDLQKVADGLLRFMVAGEVVLVVTIDTEGNITRMN
jgi:hypothetical protein